MEKDWSVDETINQIKHLLLEKGAEIERLREALRFYANRKHYDLFVRSHTSMGEYETSHILDDAGSLAREALGNE